MKNIKYIIKGGFLNSKGIKYEVNARIFEDDTPILNRENAYSYFESWISVLEEDDVNPVFKSSIFLDQEFEIKLGIGLYASIDGKEQLIDFYGEFYSFTYDSIVLGLSEEYEFYELNDFKMPEIFELTYCDFGEYTEGYEEDSIINIKHFYTSVNFEGKDVPYWWLSLDEKKDMIRNLLMSEDHIKITEIGEDHFREFKPSLVYNFKTGKGSISVKYICAKAISAFLNSSGGKLYLGISDNEGVQGLESSDFILANLNNKEPKDFVRLELDQLLRYYFKPFVNNFIKSDFEEIEGKSVFVISVSPSDQPVFLVHKYYDELKKEFYIRTNASSICLSDTEEIIEYCFSHWK